MKPVPLSTGYWRMVEAYATYRPAPMKKLYIALGVVCLIMLGVMASAGAAEEDVSLPKPTLIERLFADAIELGGYKDFCAARPHGCEVPDVRIMVLPEDIAGTFDYREPRYVNVSSELDAPGTLEWNETVVHELVHYLQWLSGKYNPGRLDVCEMHFEIESEAYTAGHKYLAKYGVIKNTEEKIGNMRFAYLMCKAWQMGM